MYAKVGSDKEAKFIEFVNALVAEMTRLDAERISKLEIDDEE